MHKRGMKRKEESDNSHHLRRPSPHHTSLTCLRARTLICSPCQVIEEKCLHLKCLHTRVYLANLGNQVLVFIAKEGRLAGLRGVEAVCTGVCDVANCLDLRASKGGCRGTIGGQCLLQRGEDGVVHLLVTW